MSRQGALTANADAAECCAPVIGTALSESEAAALARVFKALADPVRLRLLSMIAGADGGEACVCELTTGFDVSGPTISHHLKVLREAGLVDSERRGTWVWYRVRPDVFRQLGALLDLPAASAPTSPAAANGTAA